MVGCGFIPDSLCFYSTDAAHALENNNADQKLKSIIVIIFYIFIKKFAKKSIYDIVIKIDLENTWKHADAKHEV